MNRPSRAIVLLAHGSRDAQWARPVEAVAAAIRARAPGEPVHCGYLELAQPSFEAAVDAALAAGARDLRIVPLFLGLGRHAREDLPRRIAALQAAHPGVHVELRPAIGEEPELVELMARIALR